VQGTRDMVNLEPFLFIIFITNYSK